MQSSCFAAALLLIAAATAAGQQAPVRVSGRIVESGQLTPIRGATVELRGVGVLRTDAAGEFQFNRVPPGFHTIRVQALGYETLESSIAARSDTTLQLQLQPVPLPLDPIGAQASTIVVSGEVRDGATRRPVMDADIELGGRQTRTSVVGRFRVTRVPRALELPLSIRALGYLPVDIDFAAARDTALLFELEADPVAQRMLREAVSRIETRGRGLRAVGMPALGREELLGSAYPTVYDLLHRHDRLRSVRCIMIDDIQSHRGPAELQAILPHQLERIEFLERGRMLRLYTRDFVRGLMGGSGSLVTPLYVESGGLAPLCR